MSKRTLFGLALGLMLISCGGGGGGGDDNSISVPNFDNTNFTPRIYYFRS